MTEYLRHASLRIVVGITVLLASRTGLAAPGKEARISRHSVVVNPISMGGTTDKWSPQYYFEMTGPIPSAAQFQIEYFTPDKKPLCVVMNEVKEANADATLRIDGRYETKCETTATGVFSFVIRLKSDLENVNKLLYQGRFKVALDTSNKYSAFYYLVSDWLLSTGQLWLAMDHEDNPGLNASTWFKGSMETTRVGAYLFYKGKKIASSDANEEVDVSNPRDISPTGRGNAPRYVQVSFEFKNVKGYMNTEWEEKEKIWHQLIKNPGDYEIKVLVDRKLDRTIGFVVDPSGQIKKAGIVEPSARSNGSYVMVVPVNIVGAGAWDRNEAATELYYGNPGEQRHLPDLPASIMYAHYKKAVAKVDPNAGLDKSAVDKLEAAVSDASAAAAWYDVFKKDMEKTPDVRPKLEVAEEQLKTALKAIDSVLKTVPATRQFEFLNGQATLPQIKAKLIATKTLVDQLKAKLQATADAQIAPFVKLLKGDKLRIYRELGVDSTFRGRGGNKLESPQDFQGSNLWCDTRYHNVNEYNEGWEVRCFHFDGSGRMTNETRKSGSGRTAPAAGYQQ